MPPCLILLSFPAEFQSDGSFIFTDRANEFQCLRHHFADSVFVCFLYLEEVTMEEVGQAAQLRAGELIIIVVVLVMWAGNIPLQHCTFITADLRGSLFSEQINSLTEFLLRDKHSGWGLISF